MVVFFGSPDFAVPALRRLTSTDYRPELVVTQPDRPAGRGRNPTPTAVKKAAIENDIPVRTIKSFKDEDIVEFLQTLNPDFFAVAAFGLIFPQRVLDIPGKGCINLHASLLPAYRGASPVNAAILNGDPFSGVSTMEMEKELDAGPVYMQRILPVNPDETAGSLFARLAESGADLLVETLHSIDHEGLAPVPQPEEGVSYAPMLKKSDGLIDWNRSAPEIYNHIRGMNPWPGSYSYLRGRMVKIHSGFPLDLIKRECRPGEVLEASGDRLEVCCGTGAIRIEEIQLEGKKAMETGQFLCGFDMNPGEIFTGSRKG
ncbi:MAG: methionyl-tRNA formyltransferase [Candidatus Latescibacteria bacterium]|nr:methionyl-tRNA formyltransferase [bacterium]MBD3423941.1 methionyl-tRNA formyltransferase [Candidatus Latescibacterota bacterium]